MKSQINHRLIILCLISFTANLHIKGQIIESPAELAVMGIHYKNINDTIQHETQAQRKTATAQGAITAEFFKMKQWESKYVSYLKTAKGYAEALKAGTSLYADGVEMLRHIFELKNAIAANPQGIGATLAMNDLYLECAIECIKVYKLLKNSVAKGGNGNMLTGAERTEMLWHLADEMKELNNKLRKLVISIAYHNFTDVWYKYSAGIIPRDHTSIANAAFARWINVPKTSRILSGNKKQ